MRIALIKETKTPVDNRVALSPKQVADLNRRFPQHKIVVQASDIRAFSDEEYRAEGVEIVHDVEDCDILFGIKEAKIESLIANKQYFFFGHVAKMQEYNRPLLQALMKKHITFCDYEYLVDDNNIRVCAFGWWAGVVGVYYTLCGYGLRTGLFALPKPDLSFTKEKLLNILKGVKLPAVKLLVTGNGRVSKGAQYVLDAIGAKKLSVSEFINVDKVDDLSYCVADVDLLAKHKFGKAFEMHDFIEHPDDYESDFHKWSQATDILVCAHFWDNRAPVYLDVEELRSTRIKMIGDISCDIMGSVKSTLRSSTHDQPYYDYNPISGQEEKCFSSGNNISVMAVDTCPNALARDTSEYFGEMLVEHVFNSLLEEKHSDVIERATILKEGHLTKRFNYLENYSRS